MKDRLITRQLSKPDQCGPVQSGSFSCICFRENLPEPFISFSDSSTARIPHHEKSHSALRFSSRELSLDHWLPLVALHNSDRHLFLLDERQVKNFKSLFDKIGKELKTDCVFRNDYLLDLLKLVILSIGQMAENVLE